MTKPTNLCSPARQLQGNWSELKCKGGIIVQIDHFDEPSKYGINKGKISKLWIAKEKPRETLVSYDRGWDKKVTSKTPKLAKDIYKEVIRKFN